MTADAPGHSRAALLGFTLVASSVLVPTVVRAEPDPAVQGTLPSQPSARSPVAARPPAVPVAESSLGRGFSVGLVLGMYIGINTLAYLAWWQEPPKHSFAWEHDGFWGANTYAGGADKLGHIWSTHLLTRGVAQVLEAGGWPARASTYAGAGLTLGTFYVIEMRDAVTTGFSTNDMVSNVLGTATGVLLREVPVLDALFDTRVEYLPSSAYVHSFAKRGFDVAEDYSGETFLFAWHLSSVSCIERWQAPLRFMDLVVGFHAQNYLPAPADPRAVRYQDRFVGVSLNLQRVVDELWQGRHPGFGKARTRAHGVAHFATEFLNVPYTSLPLITWRGEYPR